MGAAGLSGVAPAGGASALEIVPDSPVDALAQAAAANAAVRVAFSATAQRGGRSASLLYCFLKDAVSGVPLPRPWVLNEDQDGKPVFLNSRTGAMSCNHPFEATLAELVQVFCSIYEMPVEAREKSVAKGVIVHLQLSFLVAVRHLVALSLNVLTFPCTPNIQKIKRMPLPSLLLLLPLNGQREVQRLWDDEVKAEYSSWYAVQTGDDRGEYYCHIETCETMWEHPGSMLLPAHFLRSRALEWLTDMDYIQELDERRSLWNTNDNSGVWQAALRPQRTPNPSSGGCSTEAYFIGENAVCKDRDTMWSSPYSMSEEDECEDEFFGDAGPKPPSAPDALSDWYEVS